MPGISRVNVDTAGGLIVGPGNSTVLVNGSPISIIGDAVNPPPSPATMVQGSSTVFAGGVGVVRQADLSSLGIPATGSSNVNANWDFIWLKIFI